MHCLLEGCDQFDLGSLLIDLYPPAPRGKEWPSVWNRERMFTELYDICFIITNPIKNGWFRQSKEKNGTQNGRGVGFCVLGNGVAGVEIQNLFCHKDQNYGKQVFYLKTYLPQGSCKPEVVLAYKNLAQHSKRCRAVCRALVQMLGISIVHV